MTSFEALLISKSENGQTVEWKTLTDADLMDGDVTVRVTHSTINYKDGLAITGKAPVVRRWPMVPGVDFAGVVTASTHAGFSPGDDVVATGCGLGEMHYGGYAQRARVHGEWLQKVPAGLMRADCMAIGTAGVTAMLAVMALEAHGVEPGDGPILVTGAAGGVGSVAVVLLAKLGFSVTASTGRPEIAGALKALGAADVIDRKELTGTPRPLAKERWAGAVDVAGSTTLANILSQTQYGGVVTACGLVQGIDLPTSVAPFILRAVTLVGVESVMTPRAKREEAWGRLARDVDVARLRAMTETRPLKDVVSLAPLIVAGKVKGRVVFELPELVEAVAAEAVAAAVKAADVPVAEAAVDVAEEAVLAEAAPGEPTEETASIEAADAISDEPETTPEAVPVTAEPDAAPAASVAAAGIEAAPDVDAEPATPASDAEEAEEAPDVVPEEAAPETVEVAAEDAAADADAEPADADAEPADADAEPADADAEPAAADEAAAPAATDAPPTESPPAPGKQDVNSAS